MSFLIALLFDICVIGLAAASHMSLSNTALICLAIIFAGGLAGLGND